MKNINLYLIRLFACLLPVLAVLTANAQCPPIGNVTFSSQEELDNFAVQYPTCTYITGSVIINGTDSDITDLSALSLITYIHGNLHIRHCTSLTSLSAFSSLTGLNGEFWIQNTGLTHLNNFQNLTTISGKLALEDNSNLTDISGLSNINPVRITGSYGLFITNNPNLSFCSLANFCSYLAGGGPKTISGNVEDCISVAAVTDACTTTPCVAPTGASITSVTTNTADFNWNTSSHAIAYNWVVVADGENPDTAIPVASGNTTGTTASASGLDPSTAYDFYVKAACGTGDEESTWAKVDFTTLAACPPGDVGFSTQEEIDNFIIQYPNCTAIQGLLRISGINTNITNLDGLSSLESIGGYLSIMNNFQLENLDGLRNLKSIGGGLFLIASPLLVNLDGLSALESLGGNDLFLTQNNGLTDISGLQNIDPATIGGNYGLYITDNVNLSVCNLDNLCTYLSGSGPRTISGNAQGCHNSGAIGCVQCDAPSGLSATNVGGAGATIQWVSAGTSFDLEWGYGTFLQGAGIQVSGIQNNSWQLTNLLPDAIYSVYVRQNCTGKTSAWVGPLQILTLSQCPPFPLTLQTQEEVDNVAILYPNCTQTGSITVSGPSITDLDGMNKITVISGNLMIQDNDALTDISGLANLAEVEGLLLIDRNAELVNLDGLGSLAGADAVYIRQNNKLQSINGFSSLTDVGQTVIIADNSQLSQINGFASLTEIGGNLYIEKIPATALSGFSLLETIGGNLEIIDTQLGNLDYFSSLARVDGQMTIRENAQLSDISGLVNVDPEFIDGLTIFENPVLAVCNLPNFCTYLAGDGMKFISDNAADCISFEAVSAACTCEAPGNLGTVGITTTSATLTWESDRLLFDIEWGLTGFTPGAGILVSGITSNEYEVTGLAGGQHYEFYVRSNCVHTESDWVGPFFFTPSLPSYDDGILYVDQQVSGGNGSGSSWENAIPELADALVLVQSLNTYLEDKISKIYVAKGTYKPRYRADNLDGSNPADRFNAFVLIRDVALYGGFDPAGGITGLVHDRLLPSDQGDNGGSVLSGDIDGTSGRSAADAYTVVYGIGDVGTAGLDGFTVTGGYSNGTTDIMVHSTLVSTTRGAGVYLAFSHPHLSNITITENEVSSQGFQLAMGGGLYNSFSNPVLTNVAITNNQAEGAMDARGGGIANENSSPVLNNVTISGNTTSAMFSDGAGLFNLYSNPVLHHVAITGNVGNGEYVGGGGILNNGSHPVLNNVTIAGNTISGGYGARAAAIANYDSNPSLTNVLIRNNTASASQEAVGAVFNVTSSPSLVNVAIVDNIVSAADVRGGAISSVEYSAPQLTNVTIAGNHITGAHAAGGGIFNSESSIAMTNGIITGNYINDDAAAEGADIQNDDTGNEEITLQYSLTQGYDTGNEEDHNLVGVDPLFTDAASGNYRLLACSPAINAGTPDASGLNLPSSDLAGNDRIFNGRIDMGAYEFTGTFDQSAAISEEGTNVSASQQSNGMTYYANDCRTLVAAIETTGEATDVSGPVTIRVWVQDPQPARYVRRHFQIMPDNNANGATGRVTLYFTQEDFDEFNKTNPPAKLPAGPGFTDDIANLIIEKRGGESTDESGLPNTYPGAAQTISDLEVHWNAAASRWEVSFYVTGFSGFFLKTDNSPLPVRWISFNGRPDDQDRAVLNWTAEETNAAAYEVERSHDARSFHKVAEIKAAGNGLRSYTITDPETLFGQAYYRLRQIDLDGKFSYSKIISLSGQRGAGLRLYPNPAQSSVMVEMPFSQPVSTLKVLSAAGVQLRQVQVTGRQVFIDLTGLPPGLYFIHTEDGRAVKLVKE